MLGGWATVFGNKIAEKLRKSNGANKMSHFSHEELEHPFYGHEIYADREQEYIELLLRKYKNEVASEELKKKIWDELQMERYRGHIKIPFKIALRKDVYGKFPDYVEVILDTKL